VRGDLLGDVHPATHGHGFLCEVAELMRQHGLQLAEREHVHQAEPDFEILARGEQQVRDREIVEHRRVHATREVNAMRTRRPGFGGELVQEFEERGLLGGSDFDVVYGAAVLDEDHRLQHEHGKERGTCARKQARHDVLAAGARVSGKEPPCRPAEPPRQREVGCDK
jgi:hypothetical protein